MVRLQVGDCWALWSLLIKPMKVNFFRSGLGFDLVYFLDLDSNLGDPVSSLINTLVIVKS